MACKRRRWRGLTPGASYHVPPAVAFKEVASGALEAQRWAAPQP